MCAGAIFCLFSLFLTFWPLVSTLDHWSAGLTTGQHLVAPLDPVGVRGWWVGYVVKVCAASTCYARAAQMRRNAAQPVHYILLTHECDVSTVILLYKHTETCRSGLNRWKDTCHHLLKGSLIIRLTGAAEPIRCVYWYAHATAHATKKCARTPD